MKAGLALLLSLRKPVRQKSSMGAATLRWRFDNSRFDFGMTIVSRVYINTGCSAGPATVGQHSRGRLVVPPNTRTCCWLAAIATFR